MKLLKQYAGLLLSLAVFFFLAASRIEVPGLYYDEVLWGNAALLKNQGASFVNKSWRGLPILLMDYIGALKSYLHWPVFQIFGVNAWSIRFPTVFLAAVSLVFSFLFLRRLLPYGWALAALLFLILDPSFWLSARMDYGPTTLMLFFRSLLLWGLLCLLRKPSTARVLGLLLVASLGLFDKLNFIWIVNAYGFAFLVIFWSELKSFFINQKRLHQLILVGSVALFLFLALKRVMTVSMQYGQASGLNLSQKFQDMFPVLLGTLNGKIFERFVFSESVLGSTHLAWVYISLSLVFLVYGFFSRKKTELHRWMSFLSLSFVAIFAQILATKTSGGGHHIMTLWGHGGMLLICALWLLPLKDWQKMIPVALLLGIHLLASAQTFRVLMKASDYQPKWSVDIYRLHEILERRAREAGSLNVVCADWGLCNQLSLLQGFQPTFETYDFWPAFTEKTPLQVCFPKPRSQGGESLWIFVGFVEGKESFPSTTPHVREFLARHKTQEGSLGVYQWKELSWKGPASENRICLE